MMGEMYHQSLMQK